MVKMYVKTLPKTNLQYFGRTIKEDVDKYKGSGTYWSNHLLAHGSDDVVTMIIGEFEENDPMLVEFALGFSAANDIVDSINWANLVVEHGLAYGGFQKGMVSVTDKNGEVYIVSINDERFISGNLVQCATWKGKTTVKDSKGNVSQVSKDDIGFLSGELVGIMKDKISVVDKYGNTFSVDSSDSRYISGELVGVQRGTVSVKNLNGENLRVDCNDPRYLSGELMAVTSGVFSARDSKGKLYQITSDDPRFKSGELVSVGKGIKRPRRRVVCDKCGVSGWSSKMKTHHCFKL